MSTRAGTCSAAAFYVEAHGPQGVLPMAMGGDFMQQTVSAFTAEAIGRELAATLLAKLALGASTDG